MTLVSEPPGKPWFCQFLHVLGWIPNSSEQNIKSKCKNFLGNVDCTEVGDMLNFISYLIHLSSKNIYNHFGLYSWLPLLYESEVTQSCLTLQPYGYQAPPSRGFSRQEYWSGFAISFLPQPLLYYPSLISIVYKINLVQATIPCFLFCCTQHSVTQQDHCCQAKETKQNRLLSPSNAFPHACFRIFSLSLHL